MDECRSYKYPDLFDKWLPFGYTPCLLQCLTNHVVCRSMVRKIDRYWDCKSSVLLQKSSIIQHASYVLNDHEVCMFNDLIRLRWIGLSHLHYYPFWFWVFFKFLAGVLTASICTKSLHLVAWLQFSKSLGYFEFLNGFQLMLQFGLIGMPRDVVHEAQHISTSSDGCFQWTTHVRVHEMLRLSAMGCFIPSKRNSR